MRGFASHAHGFFGRCVRAIVRFFRWGGAFAQGVGHYNGASLGASSIRAAACYILAQSSRGAKAAEAAKAAISIEPSHGMTFTAKETTLQSYYALHARIFDATRWSFLFGRERLLRRVADFGPPKRILEVGCGTGKNLLGMRRLFPLAEITGADLSADMLRVARKKLRNVTLHQLSYNAPICGDFDMVLFSYVLTMFHPGWENAIRSAAQDLRPGGLLCVVDFSAAHCRLFRRWMGLNHVRMDARLWPMLRAEFEALVDTSHSAYGGLWHYGMFVGRKKAALGGRS